MRGHRESESEDHYRSRRDEARYEGETRSCQRVLAPSIVGGVLEGRGREQSRHNGERRQDIGGITPYIISCTAAQYRPNGASVAATEVVRLTNPCTSHNYTL